MKNEIDEEFHTLLEGRWQDYQAALKRAIATIKADPDNRYACQKAWVAFVVKIAIFSVVGSAALLLALYVAMPQAWVGSSVGLVIRIWSWVALMGAPLLLLIFPAPFGYWEQRADKALEGTHVPPQHKTF